MPLSGWSYGREFSFAAVAEAADGVQCDLLLSADNFAGGFTASLADGADLRVTADDQETLLPFYVHFFDQPNQLALLTVLTPLGLTDTALWVWSGNAAATSVSSVDDTYHKASRGNGVLAAYDFDEASGATVTDKVGTADFTLVNSPTRSAASTMRIGLGVTTEDPSFTSGNGAVTFNGTTQYASAPSVLDTPAADGGLAFDLTINDLLANVSGKRILAKWSRTSLDAGGYNGIDLFFSSGNLRFRKLVNGADISLNSTFIPRQGTTTGLKPSTRYHVCLTWGSRGMEIWIDGIKNSSNATTTAWNGGTRRPLTLGAYDDTGTPSNHSPITIGAVTVYDHQPTQREIIAAVRRRSVVAEGDTQLTKLARVPSATATLAPTKAKQSTAVFEPCVIPPGNGLSQWYMFFSGGTTDNASFPYSTTWLATSADGESWADLYSDPIVGGGNGGMAGHACRNKTVWDGSQFVMFVADSVAGGADMYRLTSPTGLAGTWTLDPTPVISSGSPAWINGLANTELLQRADNTWLMTFDYNRTSGTPQWAAAQATGPTLTGAFTVDPASETGLDGLQIGTGIFSTVAMRKVGSVYYAWGHMGPTGSLPTECYAFVAPSDTGPFYPRYGAMPFIRLEDSAIITTQDQTADVDSPIEHGGKTIIFFDGDKNASPYTARIVRSEYTGTLAEFVADSPGVTAGDEYGLPAEVAYRPRAKAWASQASRSSPRESDYRRRDVR